MSDTKTLTFGHLLDLSLSWLTEDQKAALRWLPADGTARDRGTGYQAPHPDHETFLSLSRHVTGNPQSVPSILCAFCVPVPEKNEPREFDDYWKITPLGIAAVQALDEAGR